MHNEPTRVEQSQQWYLWRIQVSRQKSIGGREGSSIERAHGSDVAQHAGEYRAERIVSDGERWLAQSCESESPR